MLAQQLSRYSALFFHSRAIFNGIELSRLLSNLATLSLWATYITFSLISIVFSGEGVTWTRYGSAACVVLYVVVYVSGSASVPYILLTELVGPEFRAAATTLVGCTS
ncbi:hypothetical protein BV898_07995 [Hypsibius exemplaris]|uniref:Uncharacterized protein n=1 Tax=Hypsibius exemplaris TaxID=2072580 RepID=A0A1W0WRP3_HYPEX|nr:hypothetical protein BV898_07995 [Hypsibius exemplaris]